MDVDHSASRAVVFTDQAFIGNDTDVIQMVLSDPRSDEAATLLAKVADLSIFMASISGNVVCYFVDMIGCEVFAIDPDLDPGPTRPNRVSGMAPIVVVLADAISSRLLVSASSQKESRDINENDHPVPVTDLLGQDYSAVSLRSVVLKLEAAGIEPRLVAARRREGACRNLMFIYGSFQITLTSSIAVAEGLSSPAKGSVQRLAARAASNSAFDGIWLGRQSSTLEEYISLSAHLNERLIFTSSKHSTSVEFCCSEGPVAPDAAAVLWDSVSFHSAGRRLDRVADCGGLAHNDMFFASSVVGADSFAERLSRLGNTKPGKFGGGTRTIGFLPLGWAAEKDAVLPRRSSISGAQAFSGPGRPH